MREGENKHTDALTVSSCLRYGQNTTLSPFRTLQFCSSVRAFQITVLVPSWQEQRPCPCVSVRCHPGVWIGSETSHALGQL